MKTDVSKAAKEERASFGIAPNVPPEKPKEVPAGGDVLAPKPITIEEIKNMDAKNKKSAATETATENKTEKHGLFARLFGKKGVK